MWITTRDWKVNYEKWMFYSWNQLSGEEVEKETLNYKTSFNKCKKIYKKDKSKEGYVEG